MKIRSNFPRTKFSQIGGSTGLFSGSSSRCCSTPSCLPSPSPSGPSRIPFNLSPPPDYHLPSPRDATGLRRHLLRRRHPPPGASINLSLRLQTPPSPVAPRRHRPPPPPTPPPASAARSHHQPLSVSRRYLLPSPSDASSRRRLLLRLRLSFSVSIPVTIFSFLFYTLLFPPASLIIL